MDVLDAFPDAEVVAKTVLDGKVLVNGTAVRVVTETPPEFVPPLIEVQRLPGVGASDGLTDYSLIQLSVFGASRQIAWAIARTAEQIVLAAGRTTVVLPDGSEQLIDSVRAQNPPDQRAYEDPNKRRVVAGYRFAMRRPYRPV